MAQGKEAEFIGMAPFTDGSVRPSIGHPKYFGRCFRLVRTHLRLDEEACARRIWLTKDQLACMEDGTSGLIPTPWGLTKWAETMRFDQEAADDLGWAAGHPLAPPTEAQMKAVFPLAMKELMNSQPRFGRVKAAITLVRTLFNRNRDQC